MFLFTRPRVKSVRHTPYVRIFWYIVPCFGSAITVEKQKTKKFWKKISFFIKIHYFIIQIVFGIGALIRVEKINFRCSRFFFSRIENPPSLRQLVYIGCWHHGLPTKVCITLGLRTQRVEGVSPPYLWRFIPTYRCESHTSLVGELLLHAEYCMSSWTMVFLIFENLPCGPREGVGTNKFGEYPGRQACRPGATLGFLCFQPC